jgi:hypothetical protein
MFIPPGGLHKTSCLALWKLVDNILSFFRLRGQANYRLPSFLT